MNALNIEKVKDSLWRERSSKFKIVLVLLVLSVLVSAITFPILAYSVSKRNRMIRSLHRTIKDQEASLKLMRLELSKQKEIGKIAGLKRRDGKLSKEAKVVEAKTAKIEGKIKRLRREEAKRLERASKMDLKQQAKRVSNLLAEWY